MTTNEQRFSVLFRGADVALSHNHLHTGTNTASFLVTGQCLPDLRGPPGMVVNVVRITCALGCGCSSVVNHQHALSLQYCQEKKEKPSLRWPWQLLGVGRRLSG